MSHRPRRVSFLDREGRLKHYGIAYDGDAPRPALAAATRRKAAETIPDDAYGFTIAHDAKFAGLGLVYWWAEENEVHVRHFASPKDDPGALAPYEHTGMACVWELEVIDFERRAWLEHVLKQGDHDRYLSNTLDPVEL